jgi:alpha-tubulin suppressor-like RCC1 family protein
VRRLLLGALALSLASCGYDDVVLGPRPAGAPATGDAGLPEATVGPGRTRLSAGQYAACATLSGALYCWGDFDGDAVGSTPPVLSPAPLEPADGWDDVATGEQHACGLRGGVVWCWGTGSLGQLGRDTSGSRTPIAATALPSAATAVAVGYNHSCAILADQSLWCWGSNSYSQLARPGTPGNFDPTPAPVSDARDWTALTAGQYHTCGLRAPGTLWCWGLTDNGRAGFGETPPAAWLAVPSQVGSASNWVVVDLGQNDGCGVHADGTLDCWGMWNDTPIVLEPTPVGTETDWVSVNTDVFVRCALHRDGHLACWGRNVEGQLGTGDTTDVASPLPIAADRTFQAASVGRFATCALDTAGGVLCTGENSSGQLGLGDTERRSSLTPVVF